MAAKHSKNYSKVLNYYRRGFWNIDAVRNAVTHPENDPWITAAEFEEITGQPYNE